jgi:tRNA(Ile)-lysidine synthase
MALLDMLLNHNYNVTVCHVNYKTRQESDDEEKLVKSYCDKHNIKCYVKYFDHNYKGNFEAAARKFRYSFFEEIYKIENADGLFVAHHKDDVIETYLLKKKRNVINESYLINEKTIINNMNVYRPLIYEFYKQDLLDYCHTNNIEYGIDKTNFMDIHTRNVIRKQIETLDKEKLYERALKEEEILINTRKEVKQFIKYYPIYLCKDLKGKNDLFLSIFLYELCDKKYKRYINKSILLSLVDFLKSDKPNLSKNVKDNYYIIKNYDKIEFNYINENEFRYVLDKLEYINTPYFKLVDCGLKMHGIYVAEEDFPIVIRNYNEEDKIKLKEGSKKITRLFIDKKVPVSERKMVPIIENSKKEIIFVYNLYRKYGLKYVKNNLFMLK